MKELTFRADLYEESALASTLRVYSKFASSTLEAGPEYHRVRITATGSIDESRIADELCNYALGATIEQATKAGSPKGDLAREGDAS